MCGGEVSVQGARRPFHSHHQTAPGGTVWLGNKLTPGLVPVGGGGRLAGGCMGGDSPDLCGETQAIRPLGCQATGELEGASQPEVSSCCDQATLPKLGHSPAMQAQHRLVSQVWTQSPRAHVFRRAQLPSRCRNKLARASAEPGDNRAFPPRPREQWERVGAMHWGRSGCLRTGWQCSSGISITSLGALTPS